MIKTVSAQALSELLAQGRAHLIDVREPHEHQEESIEQAYLLPLAQCSVERLPHQEGMLVLHCRSGMRSAEACQKLLAQNPELQVASLEGGIIAWKNAGFKTCSALTE